MNRLDGAHHFTGITSDVRANLDFWCRVLGLRFVKNTLNFETTFRYHLYFGDEEGRPGSVVTFLEFNDLPKGVPGRGNMFRLILRVREYQALEFWMDRLISEHVFSEMLRIEQSQPPRLIFSDPEGHAVELRVSEDGDAPLTAEADDIPQQFRITGIEGPRSYTSLEQMLPVAERIGYERDGERLVLRGEHRTTRWYFAPPPDRPHVPRAVGVWHHIGLDAGDRDNLKAWRDHFDNGSGVVSPVFDHYFFDSCYADSPAGRIELCTTGPGFQIDEDLGELGDRLSLSPRTESLREDLTRVLTPLSNPRSRA